MGRKPDKKIQRSDLKKTWGGVFDNLTILGIYKLMSKGAITELVSLTKEGKESRVLVAKGRKGPVAVKVYAIEAASFKRMGPYLMGDPRFRRTKKDRRSLIYAWCKKEYKNLERASKAKVRCPRPLAFHNNILVMEFIGTGSLPAPRLIDAGARDPEKIFSSVLSDMKKLYQKAKLVHGDLSEFNIIISKNRPYIIDFSQSVVRDHPSAEEFLERDIYNVCRYFRKLGVGCDIRAMREEIRG